MPSFLSALTKQKKKKILDNFFSLIVEFISVIILCFVCVHKHFITITNQETQRKLYLYCILYLFSETHP